MHRPAVARSDARVVAFEVVEGNSAAVVTALQTLLVKTRAILGSLQLEVAAMNGLMDTLLQGQAAIVLDNGHVEACPGSYLGHALEDALDE